MTDKTILHYQIVKKLGQGGMGIVYLAEDTKLKRRVAIKFLPHQISDNAEERERFIVEARAAAALNHPNLATIHAIEESDDHIFIVMEFIDGQELKEEIKSRKLEIRRILDIAIQIASGLQAAHDKEIVHRDIKSTNIMLTRDGQVKIMDFGLAKMLGTEQLTREGTTLGTAAYMSPEQARNESVDSRSDIWSFGVILYEMLSGQIPFNGNYEAAIMYDILHAEPEPVNKINPNIPENLGRIVGRCLEKDVTKRYQKAADIIAVLKSAEVEIRNKIAADSEKEGDNVDRQIERKPFANRDPNKLKRKKYWIPLAVLILVALIIRAQFYFNQNEAEMVSSNKKMLVVLPFRNLGAEEEEYFADGITGEIISRLSGISGIGVIARSGSMLYKNSKKPVEQIGEELGVQYILEGTVQWEHLPDGKRRVRVNPGLIQISNGTQIWSHPYEADFSSVFKLQSDIATQVVSALDITLLRDEKQTIGQELTRNSEAYDYYLRGLDYAIGTYDRGRWAIAEQMFEKAITLDPQFAAAYARLSILHSDMYWFHYDRTEERLKKSLEAVERAQQIDPGLYLIYSAKGWYYYHGKLEYENALNEFDRSLEIQPNDEDAYMGIASVLRRQGKMEEALSVFKKAIAMNPRSHLNYDQAGETLFLLRRYKEAAEYLNQAVSMAPDDALPYNYNAWTQFNLDKNTKEARKILEDHLDIAGLRLPEFLFTLARFDILDRQFDSALQRLETIDHISSQFEFYPKEMLKAEIYGFKKDYQLKKQYYLSAADIVKSKILEQPDDPRFHSTLGIIYAGLGNVEEAVRSGRQGMSLMPVTKEAWRGSFRVLDMAKIYTMVGEDDKAINLLDQLLAMPSDLDIYMLKLDPTWDPLRRNPRFQDLLMKYTS